MAFKLSRAGTIEREDLGDTGITAVYRTPDQQTAKEIQRQFNLAAKNNDRVIDTYQVVIGLVVNELEGIELDGENSYKLEKDKTGKLTDESFSVVAPLSQRLLRLIAKTIGIEIDEQKNS
jgi:hypothetical protein